jgi:beta-lactamase regulating signal transducer with metallopeptidase domain
MTESLQTISQAASGALISSIWQGAILAALAWLCLKLAPRTSAGLRFGIWAAVFAATALLPLQSPLQSMIANAGAAGTGMLTHSSAPVILLDSRWALGLAAAWATLVAARMLALAKNAFKARALWKTSTPVALTSGLQAALNKPGLRGAILCTSSAIDQPCVIGFFSPRILIPAWLMKGATPSELEQIVLHESAHLRRFDDWTNLAQKLALALFPLNPALFWIERRLCADREVACDESVVRTTNAPRDYATCLTHLAEQRLARRTMSLSGALSLGAWERRSQLSGRVESILLGKAKLGPLQARALALSMVLATVGGSVKLGSSSQLVAFASAPSHAQLEEASRSVTAGPHYRNVVFHPATGAARLAANNPIAPIAAGPVKHPVARPVVKESTRRARRNRVESLLIVTRWQTATGQQLTVIDQVVRIPALSAAQSQGGWFVVQL